MHYYLVTPLSIVHGNHSQLTYHSDAPLVIGNLVRVSVGAKLVSAVVTQPTTKPRFATKSIDQLLESAPLPHHLLGLSQWLSQYYATHPATVWQTLLPRGLGIHRRSRPIADTPPQRDRTHIVLNGDQRTALDTTLTAPSRTSLLHGITGSGKTHIYIEATKHTLATGQSAIILVPEISLTPQLIADFTPHFPTIIVTHSTMTEAERHLAWQRCLQTTGPIVVIGPRSALFSPLPNLGLIVIDECHEPSFKQEQAPRYSALRTAGKLAELADARLILGSATPSVVDYYLAQQTHASIITLNKSARPGTIAPTVTRIDMTKRASFGRHRFLSTPLLQALTETLTAGNQSLIFHNRRGTAPTTLCESCGWNALCERCFVPLTLHHDQYQLRCHICDQQQPIPNACPQCGTANIIHKGIGTKMIHQELSKIFTQARIMRFDGDTESTQTLDHHYQALYDGDIDIIIGTQIIAKGLDLPYLRTVGVVQADSGLALPDYQSAERVFQLINQVSGRVGRNEHPSQVIIQSYQPTHPAVQLGIDKDYGGFYEHTLAERRRANFPPFTYLLKCVCHYKTEAAAHRAALALAQTFRTSSLTDIEILGPTPAFYERVRDTYRWQIILKSPVRRTLIDAITLIPTTPHWRYELDPASLL